jgi:hypothetical protein
MPDEKPKEGTRPLELLIEEFKPEAWLVAAARAGRKWEDGQQLTREEFQQALEEAKNIQIRGA